MLEKLTIKGFKSIQSLDGLDLHAVCERCPHFDGGCGCSKVLEMR